MRQRGRSFTKLTFVLTMVTIILSAVISLGLGFDKMMNTQTAEETQGEKLLRAAYYMEDRALCQQRQMSRAIGGGYQVGDDLISAIRSILPPGIDYRKLGHSVVDSFKDDTLYWKADNHYSH